MRTNLWTDLVGLMPAGRYIKGNVTAENADGSYSVTTSDGAVIRVRSFAEQTWNVSTGVFVQNGRIVGGAPNLPGATQFI